MELTMYTYFSDLIKRQGAREAVRMARECGFASVEILEIVGPGTAPLFENEGQARELRSLLEENGLRCACYSVGIYLPADDLGPSRDQSAVDILRSCADYACILGSPYLHHTLLPGRVSIEASSVILDRLLPELLARAGQVADYNSLQGLTTLYEPQGYYVNAPDGFARFYEEMKRRGYAVGVCGDVGNPWYADSDPVDFFARYAREIRHVHIKDVFLADGREECARISSRPWDLTADGRFVIDAPLGQGVVDIDACMAHLRRVGYRGAYALETFYENSEDVALQECLTRDRDFMLERYGK
jgi:sugar phosphate isomerase/epimerase